MSEMNFIPARMAKRHLNQRLISKSGKLIISCIAFLLLSFFAITAYNQQIKKEISSLTNKKNQINKLLSERTSEKLSLQKTKSIAASLENLNSFNALTAVLDMLNSSIPEETELSDFETEFDQNGQSIVTLNGISDSHQNLTQWVSTLQAAKAVKSVELISSESVQISGKDELKQKFSIQITRLAVEKS